MSYGKSNDRFSFLYYPIMTMQICINGQLLLTKLLEMFYEASDIQPIQANTDGVTIRVRRSDIDKIHAVAKQWMEMTGLELEHVEYSKMIIRDCNNYIAIKQDSIKTKGIFEINEKYKKYNNEPIKELHKDHSAMIVPKALLDYFVSNIPVEDTIKNHTNMFDFYMMLRGNNEWSIETVSIAEDVMASDEEQKVTRYYIGKSGTALTRINNMTGKRVGYNKGFNIIVDNNKDETKTIEDYNINYNFYISECYKIINSITTNQLTLSLL